MTKFPEVDTCWPMTIYYMFTYESYGRRMRYLIPRVGCRMSRAVRASLESLCHCHCQILIRIMVPLPNALSITRRVADWQERPNLQSYLLLILFGWPAILVHPFRPHAPVLGGESARGAGFYTNCQPRLSFEGDPLNGSGKILCRIWCAVLTVRRIVRVQALTHAREGGLSPDDVLSYMNTILPSDHVSELSR
jgi:hypothetical protein